MYLGLASGKLNRTPNPVLGGVDLSETCLIHCESPDYLPVLAKGFVIGPVDVYRETVQVEGGRETGFFEHY